MNWIVIVVGLLVIGGIAYIIQSLKSSTDRMETLGNIKRFRQQSRRRFLMPGIPPPAIRFIQKEALAKRQPTAVEEVFRKQWEVDYWKPGSHVFEFYHNKEFLKQREAAREKLRQDYLKEFHRPNPFKPAHTLKDFKPGLIVVYESGLSNDGIRRVCLINEIRDGWILDREHGTSASMSFKPENVVVWEIIKPQIPKQKSN